MNIWNLVGKQSGTASVKARGRRDGDFRCFVTWPGS